MADFPGVLRDLALSGAHLDRATPLRADPDLLARLLADTRTAVIEVVGDRLLVEPVGADAAELAPVRRAPSDVLGSTPVADDAGGPDDVVTVFLGEVEGVSHVALLRPPCGQPSGTEAEPDPDLDRWPRAIGLRACGLALSDSDRSLAATALALANWHRRHVRCPLCGAPTVPDKAGWTRRCPQDGSEHFPRTDPAVIMSVLDEHDRLLLGRNPAWPARQFSVLAGFVEPGESFELAVAREVYEEVGVRVTDARYLGSQPWPFPASVMIGFTCRAVTTDLVLDPEEIAEARWVTRDEYRKMLVSMEIRVPTGISIARRLIERWLGHSVDTVVS